MTENTPRKPNRDAVLDALVERYAIFKDAKPLMIGIHKAIMERQPELTKPQVSKALRIHTAQTRYLKALAKAGERYDLDGNPAGEVTQEQRDAAALMVQERIQKAAEKRKTEAAQRREEEAAKQREAKLQQLAAKFNQR